MHMRCFYYILEMSLYGICVDRRSTHNLSDVSEQRKDMCIAAATWSITRLNIIPVGVFLTDTRSILPVKIYPPFHKHVLNFNDPRKEMVRLLEKTSLESKDDCVKSCLFSEIPQPYMIVD